MKRGLEGGCGALARLFGPWRVWAGLLLLLGGALILLGASCEAAAGAAAGLDKGELDVLFWNVQALFDGEESGSEYLDYMETAGWSAEKYRARITAMAKGISQIPSGFPDILALAEIENPQTLLDMAESLASLGGSQARYRYSSFANVSGMSLGLGILSKIPLVQQRAHSFTAENETTPRPVAEVWVEAEGIPLALFICHWKSKLGGDEKTEGQRRASARLILRRLREIEAETPGTPVLIMGDLNENHDEYYRQAGRYICALLPDDPKAAHHAGLARDGGAEAGSVQTDFLVLSGNKPPRSAYFAEGTAALYSPWGKELKGGSYFYSNDWETIDHFLLNSALFDGQGWEFEGGETLRVEPFVNAQGTPNLYSIRTGGGLSDHLPLRLSLKLLSP
ncbi:MAG: endonuclease/exonuclease/phosphatase family protein, partial [Treponema sp.]|nr:endonuclease/exonuclease/phosphatase family protein [Treponema sp.]